MPESRYRLSSVREEVATLFSNQRRASRALVIYSDEAEPRSTFRWGTTPLTGVTTRLPLQTATTRGRASGGVQRRNVGGGGSVLPSWYPRVPLRDITAIVRAIERRTLSSSVPEDELEDGSPIPPQNQSTAEGADDCFTPKQPVALLDNTDSVVKAILENSRQLKSTPSAKKAERVRKVQTLMSMR